MSDKMGDDNEINKENIEELMNQAISEGQVEDAGTKDGERTFKISEQGEAHVIETLIGGQDVANVVAGFMNIIKLHGNALNNRPYEPNITSYFEFIRIVQVVKHCGDWGHLVIALEKDLEENSKWFEKK